MRRTVRVGLTKSRRRALCLRRAGLSLLALLVASPPASANLGDPGVVVRRDADASWTVGTGGSSQKMYWLWVRRIERAGLSVVTHVRLTQHRCTEDRRSRFCRPQRVIEKTIPNRAFRFDDRLESASVRFRHRGRRHRATWTGTSDLGRSEFDRECSSGPVGDAARGFGRAGTSTGRLFGNRVEASDMGRWDSAYLSLMIVAKTC